MKEIKLLISNDNIRRLLVSLYMLADSESDYIVSERIFDVLDTLIVTLENALNEEE